MAIRTGRALYEGRHPHVRGYQGLLESFLVGASRWARPPLRVSLGVAMRTVLAASALAWHMCMGMGM